MFPDDTEPVDFDQHIVVIELFLAETEGTDVYVILNEERIEELNLGFNLSFCIEDDNGKMVNLSEGIRSCLRDIKYRQEKGPLQGEMVEYVGMKTLFINLLEDGFHIAKKFRIITGK